MMDIEEINHHNHHHNQVTSGGDSKQLLQHTNTGGFKSSDLKNAVSINNSALVLSQKSQEGLP